MLWCGSCHWTEAQSSGFVLQLAHPWLKSNLIDYFPATTVCLLGGHLFFHHLLVSVPSLALAGCFPAGNESLPSLCPRAPLVPHPIHSGWGWMGGVTKGTWWAAASAPRCHCLEKLKRVNDSCS